MFLYGGHVVITLKTVVLLLLFSSLLLWLLLKTQMLHFLVSLSRLFTFLNSIRLSFSLQLKNLRPRYSKNCEKCVANNRTCYKLTCTSCSLQEETGAGRQWKVSGFQKQR